MRAVAIYGPLTTLPDGLNPLEKIGSTPANKSRICAPGKSPLGKPLVQTWFLKNLFYKIRKILIIELSTE